MSVRCQNTSTRRTEAGTRAAPRVAALGAALLVLAGCTSAAGDDTPDDDSPDGTPAVVATTTVLGDVAGRVAECGGLEARTLMPVGADPHDFAPSSADVRDLVRADLVVANGLGLEEGLGAALASARADGATVLEVAPLLDPIPMSDEHSHEGEHEHAHEGDDHEADEHHDDEAHEAEAHDEHAHDDEAHDDEAHAHEHGSLDPHVWLDADRMARAARLIGDELARITGDDALAACGDQVGDDLDGVDAEVREILAAVPNGSRVLITDHAAFGYFADAYGFEIPGVVVPGGSTLAEPSSAELAALAAVIRESGVRAIFANTADSTDLVAALATEVGRVEVVELYVGSLGPDGSGAEDYAGMMRTNAGLVAQALTE